MNFYGYDLASAQFWTAFGTIVLADIILAGDNAVVIAMAARSLTPEQQKRAIQFGAFGAIAMRIVLAIVAIQLLALPFLKIVGGLLLVYIGVDLVRSGGDDEDGGHAKEINSMWAAVRTILLADLVMSLDNVLAVAAASKGDVPLLIAGLILSVPLILYGATVLAKLMEKFPIIITLGAAMLGFLAGEMIVTDPAFVSSVAQLSPMIVKVCGLVGAILVIAIAKWLNLRTAAKQAI